MAADPEVGSGGARKTVVADELTASRRWMFVTKVYLLILLQVLITGGMCVTAVLVHPFPKFFTSSSPGGWVTYILIPLVPFLVTWPLLKYKKNQGINLLLLSLFTISVSISAAVSCSTSAGRGVLQSAVLLPVSLTVLTVYTFWAASGGYDFIFLEPFAITSLVVAVVYLAEQAFVPLATVGTTAYGAGATIVFTAFLIFETKRIVKTHSSEEYVIGAITMYVDIMSLFMAQPTFK